MRLGSSDFLRSALRWKSARLRLVTCALLSHSHIQNGHNELSAVQENLKRRHYFMTAQFNLLLKEFPKTTPEKKKVRPSRERQKNPGAC